MIWIISLAVEKVHFSVTTWSKSKFWNLTKGNLYLLEKSTFLLGSVTWHEGKGGEKHFFVYKE